MAETCSDLEPDPGLEPEVGYYQAPESRNSFRKVKAAAQGVAVAAVD